MLCRLSVVFVIAALVPHCSSPEPQWQSLHPEEGEPSLVVVFRRAATSEEVLQTISRITERDVQNARWRFPQVRSTVKVKVDDRAAYVVAMHRGATDEQVVQVRKLLASSAAVLKVFENRAPESIRPTELIE